MNQREFLKLTLKDGFEMLRLANLKMPAEAREKRIIEEWADAVIENFSSVKNWNVDDDYARIMRAFTYIRDHHDELGAFRVLKNLIADNPRKSVSKPVAIEHKKPSFEPLANAISECIKKHRIENKGVKHAK